MLASIFIKIFPWRFLINLTFFLIWKNMFCLVLASKTLFKNIISWVYFLFQILNEKLFTSLHNLNILFVFIQIILFLLVLIFVFINLNVIINFVLEFLKFFSFIIINYIFWVVYFLIWTIAFSLDFNGFFFFLIQTFLFFSFDCCIYSEIILILIK